MAGYASRRQEPKSETGTAVAGAAVARWDARVPSGIQFAPQRPSDPIRASRRLAFALVGPALLAGCAVGPDFRRPAPPAVEAYTARALPAATAETQVAGGEAQRFVQGLDLPGQWWELFGSPALNAMVEESLRAHPNVAAAHAALRQAQQLVRAQQGFFFPAVQGSYTGTRQRTPQVLSSPLNTPPPEAVFNLHTAQLSVGYVPDVFGANRRQVESLQALAEAQRFQIEATYLTLSSNVVAAVVQEASLRAQIASQTEIIETVTRSLGVLRSQFEAGFASGLDVAAQEAALAVAKQALPPLQKQLDLTHDLLAALTGRLPSEAPESAFGLDSLRLPQDLPVSVPSRLVEQRPDVRAAAEQLHAASAQIGVALANMLPQIAITGAKGGTSTEFGQMFALGNVFWFLTASVTQPIFQGGTLVARKRAAEAAFDQAAALYRSTVITAFQNVADALQALERDAEALQATAAAEAAAKRTLDLTLKQQRLGFVNILAVLNAQQTYRQALIARVQAQATRFGDTAALFQALGGGWWNRAEVAAAQSEFNPDARAAKGCGRYDDTGAGAMPRAPCGPDSRESDRPADPRMAK